MMGNMSKSLVSENFERVLGKIETAAHSSGRDAEQIRLIVVTKGHSIDRVRGAISAGARLLGENYVQEALPKISTLNDEFDLEWHMIGHIQSRKARLVSENFDWIHTIDSLRLAKRLDRFAGEIGKRLPVLLEFNMSGEDTKYGWMAWNNLEWDGLADEFAPIFELSNLDVHGVMTMAPYFKEPERSRPHFIRLRKLNEYLASRFPEASWKELSMGMSTDFEIAIQEGATIVRIGTAILGERNN
jgi:pyridoxal phosphate enzyme (YggS family)